MRFTTLLAVSYGVATSATSIPGFVQQLPGYDSVSELASSRELYLIEVAAGDTRWVTDEEKWQLRRVG
jgi:leucyl aminopeptidase